MTVPSIRRLISLFLIVTFVTSMVIMPRASFAQATAMAGQAGVMGLPQPGTMVDLSSAYVPLMVSGLTIHPENPLLMDFIVSTGNSGLKAEEVKKESDRLIKYFLACLTIPENNQWVNLSPYEKDRIIPEDLGKTVLGQDMLAQDYLLKQLTASLIYPEKNLGKTFWDKVYAKAGQMYGSTQIPVNTFNKVWILPDTAKVYEHNNTVFVVKSHLKVMLDEDYLAMQKHANVGEASQGNPQTTNTLGNQIVREIVLPQIEQEVNTGKNFAQLRQIYNSMILAVWFKKNLKQALLNQVYTDKSKVNGVNVDDPAIKEKIYRQYIQAYKKGVFNYIKEEVDQSNQQVIPRKYFSGGLTAVSQAMLSEAPVNEAMTAIEELRKTGPIYLEHGLSEKAGRPAINPSAAMTVEQKAPAIIAVDIGGTSVVAAAVTLGSDGNPSKEIFRSTMLTSEAKGTPGRFFDKLADLIIGVQIEARQRADIQMLPFVGIGSPGRFIDDGHGGKMVAPGSAANLGYMPSAFDGVNPERELKARLPGITSVVHNDGIAQMMFLYKSLSPEVVQRLKGRKVAYIGPGTGLGGGFLNLEGKVVTDGHIYDLKLPDQGSTFQWQGRSLQISLPGVSDRGAEWFFSGGNALATIMMKLNEQALAFGLELPFPYEEDMRRLNEEASSHGSELPYPGNLTDENNIFQYFRDNGGKSLNEVLKEGNTADPKYVLAKQIAEFEGKMLALIVEHIYNGKIEKVNSSANWSDLDKQLVEGTKDFLLGGNMMTGEFGKIVKRIAEEGLRSQNIEDINLIIPVVDTKLAGVLGAAGFVAEAAAEAVRQEAAKPNPVMVTGLAAQPGWDKQDVNAQIIAIKVKYPRLLLPPSLWSSLPMTIDSDTADVADYMHAASALRVLLKRLSNTDQDYLLATGKLAGEVSRLYSAALALREEKGRNREKFSESKIVKESNAFEEEVKVYESALQARSAGNPAPAREDHAMRGGIDLASKHLNMQSSGQKVNITFDPAMIAQFKRGDFSGVRIQILDVVPISLMPLLGLKEEEIPTSVG